MNKINKLIINSPYAEPTHYWSYDRETRLFDKKEGRRPAGYIIASESSRSSCARSIRRAARSRNFRIEATPSRFQG